METDTERESRKNVLKPSFFRPVKNELAQTETLMYETLASDSRLLSQVSTHLLRSGGKRIRPALLLLSNLTLSPVKPPAVEIAAAVELIHMATLVHDDVVDQSPVRRGAPTVNERWDEQVSVLSGDHLFARSFSILAQQDKPRIVQIMADVVSEMCTGEFFQIEDSFQFDQNEDDYFQRIYRKTGCLIQETCRLGAVAASASPEIEHALVRYGYGVGMAFQVIDDILDLQGENRELGKPVGSDIRSGHLTLPVLHALRTLPDAGQLVAIVKKTEPGDDDILRVRQILDGCGSFEYAYSTADRFITEASKALSELPDNRGRTALKELAEFIRNRRY